MTVHGTFLREWPTIDASGGSWKAGLGRAAAQAHSLIQPTRFSRAASARLSLPCSAEVARPLPGLSWALGGHATGRVRRGPDSSLRLSLG